MVGTERDHADAERDHLESDAGLLAGVTDRGVRHQRNEDAMALSVVDGPDGRVALAVVCDGVSSTPRPDEASATAVRIAMDLLREMAVAGDDPDIASRAAMHAASAALGRLAGPEGAPAATYISAIISGRDATVCWVGDSRAYWLVEGDGSRRLTADDSVAGELVEAGLLTEEAAMASAHAHVITKWLGANLPDPQPHLARFSSPGPGILLICTDGLWNYLPEADGLAARALPGALTDPLGAASALVEFAVNAGGADNVTVVLAPVR